MLCVNVLPDEEVLRSMMGVRWKLAEDAISPVAMPGMPAAQQFSS
jgi:hypothetical protein